MEQIRKGILLSYILLIFNTLSGILLTPFLLRNFGEVEYGIYQLMISVASYLTILNLGTGSAMNRFVTIYRSRGETQKEQRYIFLNLIVDGVICAIILMSGCVLGKYLPKIYPNVLNTPKKIILGTQLYFLSMVNICITIFTSSFEGLNNAYGNVGSTKAFGLVKLLGRMCLIFGLVQLGYRSIVIAWIDLVSSICYLVFLVYLCLKKLGIKISPGKVSKSLFKETLLFSMSCLLSGLSGQLNNNIDKTLLGIFSNEFYITIYSISTTFYMMYTSIIVSMNGIFLNKISFLVAKNNQNEINRLNLKASRIQSCFGGLLFFGFILVGKEFIHLWLGSENYDEVYLYSIILMFPNYFLGISGLGETVLEAMNLKLFKSVNVFLIGIVNVVITVGLINVIGPIGTAVGTCISLFLGYDIIMNVYYHKKVKLNILEVLRETFKKAIPMQVAIFIIAILCKCILKQYIVNEILCAVITGMVFVVIYLLLEVRYVLCADN